MKQRDRDNPAIRAMRADQHRFMGFHRRPLIPYSDRPVGIVYAATLRRRRTSDQ